MPPDLLSLRKLQVMVTNMQLLKPRKVCYGYRPEDCARDVLSAGCSRATGLIESREHGFQSNARLLRCRRSGWGIHSFGSFHFQKCFSSEDALEDEEPHDRAKKEGNCRERGRDAGDHVCRLFHDASDVLYDLGR